MHHVARKIAGPILFVKWLVYWRRRYRDPWMTCVRITTAMATAYMSKDEAD